MSNNKAILHFLIPSEIEVTLTPRQQSIIRESQELLKQWKPVVSHPNENGHLRLKLDALEVEFYNSGFEGLPPKAQQLRIELPDVADFAKRVAAEVAAEN